MGYHLTMTGGRDTELAFARDVYDARLSDVQAEISRQRLAGVVLFDPENIYWLTGYQSIGYFTFQCLFVPAADAPALISRKVNRFLASATPTLAKFVEIRDTHQPTEVLANYLDGHTPSGSRLGLETTSWYLTVHDHRQIQRRLTNRDLVEWGGFIEARRTRKTEPELRRIRDAARTAVAAVEAALGAVSPGATENDIAAAMYEANIREGSEYLGHPPLVVSGERTALCFAMWRRRTVQAGDVVLLEAGGCIDRYHAMIARSAVVGPPSVRQRRAAETIIRALDAAIDAMRPGRTSGEVDAVCRRVVEAAGFGDAFVHRTAYSVGIGFPPNWAEGKTLAIRPQDPTRLESGMTFHVVPTLFLGDFGMCFSETVLVTETAAEVLTHYPRRLFVTEG